MYQQQQSEGAIEAVADEFESHGVIYQYLFQENKKKVVSPPEKQESLSDKFFSKHSRREKASNRETFKYISAFNTRRNPDILVPGANFLKGATYFRNKVNADKVKEDHNENGDSSNEDAIDLKLFAEADEYDRLLNQKVRYFKENITIKCSNCMECGHMARECPKKQNKVNCIRCSKDTHDSFSCNKKLCFKCNKFGHVAVACKERNIIKCKRCGLNGHTEMRCLKGFKGDFIESQMQFLRCMECGKHGHIKCTREKVSASMKIDTMVKDDLQEFLYAATKVNFSNKIGKSNKLREIIPSFGYVDGITENSSWLNETTNLKVSDQKSDNNIYNKVYINVQQKQGIPMNHKSRDIYCCQCGNRHHYNECPSLAGRAGNQKFQQFCRQKLNDESSTYEQTNEYYSSNRNNKINTSGNNSRIEQDPHLTKIDTSNAHRSNGQKYKEQFSSSYSEEEESTHKKGKRKHIYYSQFDSGFQDDNNESKCSYPGEFDAREFFIGDLAFSAGEDSLRSSIDKFGKITNIKMPTDMSTVRSKGVAFVEFASHDEVQKACDRINGQEFEGRSLRINFSGGLQNFGGARDTGRPQRGGDAGGDSTTLFVGNLGFKTEVNSLTQFFSQFGNIKDIRLVLNEEGGTKGFAHVQFETFEATKKALEFNGADLDGRALRLELSQVSSGGSRCSRVGRDFGGRGVDTSGDSTTLFVGNLGFRTGVGSLTQFFSQCGDIKDVRIALNQEGRVKGFAHVDFETVEATKKALEFNGADLNGRSLRLELSQGSSGCSIGVRGGRGGCGGDRGKIGALVNPTARGLIVPSQNRSVVLAP